MELDQEILQLERQLQETLAAEQLLEHNSGKLLIELFAKQITKLTNEITGEKYLKDHQGYMYAVAKLQAYRNILKSIQIAASPARRDKIRERLEDKKGIEKSA